MKKKLMLFSVQKTQPFENISCMICIFWFYVVFRPQENEKQIKNVAETQGLARTDTFS